MRSDDRSLPPACGQRPRAKMFAAARINAPTRHLNQTLTRNARQFAFRTNDASQLVEADAFGMMRSVGLRSLSAKGRNLPLTWTRPSKPHSAAPGGLHHDRPEPAAPPRLWPALPHWALWVRKLAAHLGRSGGASRVDAVSTSGGVYSRLDLIDRSSRLVGLIYPDGTAALAQRRPARRAWRHRQEQ
jgi:hypothetical protein